VPRLAVTTNYATFQTVRQAASESLFFALKMADDYDALQQADELAHRMSDLVEKELDKVQDDLREAYKQIGEARTKLDAAQAELNLKGQDLAHLETRVKGIAKEKIEVQRAFSAACQLFGGLMNICPIGQPVLRGVGNVFAVASEFDWNKPHPWEEAGKTFEKVGSSVTEFMEKNEKVLTQVDDSDRLSAKEQALNLGRRLGAMKSALGEDTNAIRATLGGLDDTHRLDFTTAIESLKNKINEGDAALEGLAPALKAPVKDLQTALKQELASKVGSKIGRDLEAYRAQLKQLEAKRPAVIKQILSMGGFPKDKLKVAADVSDRRMNEWLMHKDAFEKLGAERETVKQKVKSYKLENKRAQEKKKEVLESIKGLGDGIANVGSAIAKVAAPFDEDDPAVKSLVERMLDSKSSEFHPKFEKLKEDLIDLAKAKKRAAENLMHWHQAATALTGQLSGSLNMLDALGREQQSLSGVLDAGTRTFLKGMQQRARAALQRSIYDFVQAYQYEFLADPGDDFFSFDDWVKRLRNVETGYLTAAQEKLANVKANKKASAADIAKAEQEVNQVARQVIRLGEDDFKKVEEDVLRDQLLAIFVKLLGNRESVAKARKNRYDECVFSDAMLDTLNATGSVTFNFVRDFHKGTFKDVDFRALDVALDAFEAEVSDRNLSLRIRILHSGESVILDKKDDKPVYYGFRAARNDDPISWSFTWNQKAGAPPISADQDVKVEIDKMLGTLLTQNKIEQIEEYKPSLFSDFEFWISNLSAEDGKLVFKDPKDPEKKRILATVVINRVVLSVGFQDRTTLRAPAHAADSRATGA
jgi:chromosome segregation ATPase